jgi:hypothetical protein
MAVMGEPLTTRYERVAIIMLTMRGGAVDIVVWDADTLVEVGPLMMGTLMALPLQLHDKPHRNDSGGAHGARLWQTLILLSRCQGVVAACDCSV